MADTRPADILDRLADLHTQATVERSHYYTGACVRDAMAEIARLRAALRIIAGEERCLDTLLGNADVARIALHGR